MGFFDFLFTSQVTGGSSDELPEIFPLALRSDAFIKADIISTYTKILTDCIERTHGIPEDIVPSLWDSCLQNEAAEGLISLLARAMYDQSDLFLVYVKSVKVLRRATHLEQEKIRADYKTAGTSSAGAYISFKNYSRTDMLKIYSAFEHCVLGSLNKTLNISKAVQIKINDLRASVSLADADVAKTQALAIAKALAAGKDIMLDSKDMVETAKPDTSSSEKAINFIDAKKAFILDAPISYISGQQTTGIGSTGEADMRAVERCLKQYWNPIIRPALKGVFGIETTFKSQDFREMGTAMEVTKTFDLVSDEILSRKTKGEILARVWNIDPKQEEKNIEAEANQREAEGEDEEDAAPLLEEREVRQ